MVCSSKMVAAQPVGEAKLLRCERPPCALPSWPTSALTDRFPSSTVRQALYTHTVMASCSDANLKDWDPTVPATCREVAVAAPQPPQQRPSTPEPMRAGCA